MLVFEALVKSQVLLQHPTQQTQHLPCHIVAGGGRGHIQQGNSRAASSLQGPSSTSSAQPSILGCVIHPGGLKAQCTVKAAFLLISTLQLDGLSGLNTHTKGRCSPLPPSPAMMLTGSFRHTHSPAVWQGCIESYNCNSQKCEEKNQQRHRYLGSRQCYFPPSRQQS